MDESVRRFLSEKLGPEDPDRLAQVADPISKHCRTMSRTNFSRNELLACFGLDDYSWRDLVEWGNKLSVKVVNTDDVCTLDALEAFDVGTL